MFDRSRKNQKVRVPEYTFSLLPRNLVHFGFCTNLVRFRFSSLNKLVERTARGPMKVLHETGLFELLSADTLMIGR